jgi:hypothetical protein
MRKGRGSGTTTQLSVTRTNNDGIMIFLGIALIIFFILSGVSALDFAKENPGKKVRGPVKDPKMQEKNSAAGESPLSSILENKSN